MTCFRPEETVILRLLLVLLRLFADKCKAEPYFLGLHFSLKITSVCVGQCTDYMKNFNDCFMSALQTLCM